jgi:hypothetical protein
MGGSKSSPRTSSTLGQPPWGSPRLSGVEGTAVPRHDVDVRRLLAESGRVLRVETFTDRAQGLVAVGLRE